MATLPLLRASCQSFILTQKTVRLRLNTNSREITQDAKYPFLKYILTHFLGICYHCARCDFCSIIGFSIISCSWKGNILNCVYNNTMPVTTCCNIFFFSSEAEINVTGTGQSCYRIIKLGLSIKIIMRQLLFCRTSL